ncbi:uncharacterized protein AB675_2079 [Cyphellophora attinorum]|uniref:CENP-V/GFA domain-containing protein n=1 Tax=Cyphellophora attinorum TaxID=1664694 RepID=A0A0N1P105_9EURO|nr:uncharacterized protein AB675_2079 [Phialophora attinorum]KPI42915.1 hypothetical protein AB675_2079 [Phialophora attinorum]
MPTGSCICGAIKYSFDVQPSAKVSTHTTPEHSHPQDTLRVITHTPLNHQCLCHCLSCRRITGTTAASVALIPKADFQTTASAESVPSFRQNTITHEAGMQITYVFCSDCGTTCWKTANAGWPDQIIVFTGTLDDASFEQFKPDAEFWVKYRAPWLESLEGKGVAQVQGFPEA